jgi:hypothetical protein
MSPVRVLLGDATLSIPGLPLITNCDLYRNNLALAAAIYPVRTECSIDDFHAFLSALEGKKVIITPMNHRSLSELCEEFGYGGLAEALAEFRGSAVDPDGGEPLSPLMSKVMTRLSCLAERQERQARQIAALELVFGEFTGVWEAVRRLAGDFEHLGAAVSAIERRQPSAVAAPAPLSDSRIVSAFPALFEEFRAKHWKLLYRGTRDGFGTVAFHSRCDGHANTVVLIGGFTPVPWDSIVFARTSSWYREDPSRQSFLFTLNNPHRLPPQRFHLLPSQQGSAVVCRGCVGSFFDWSGPFAFGRGHDIIVSENCDENRASYSALGTTYANDTGVNGKLLLAGSRYFKVREIEVFELSD